MSVTSKVTILHKAFKIRLKGAWRIDQGLEMSRSIGDIEYRKRGVISTPTLSHLSLDEGIGSLILVSDGISDKVSGSELCAIVEEAKMGCPIRLHAGPQDEAIPLFGTSISDAKPETCHPLRLGLDPNFKGPFRGRRIPFKTKEISFFSGLRGCLDCFTEQTCSGFDTNAFEFPETIERSLASLVVEEATNRRSTDNLAIALLNFSPVRSKTCFQG